jgi:hypothetical protein
MQRELRDDNGHRALVIVSAGRACAEQPGERAREADKRVPRKAQRMFSNQRQDKIGSYLRYGSRDVEAAAERQRLETTAAHGRHAGRRAALPNADRDGGVGE